MLDTEFLIVFIVSYKVFLLYQSSNSFHLELYSLLIYIKNFILKNVIYQATIKTSNESKSYIGLSANPLKRRVAVHRTTINSKPEDRNYLQYKQATELSKYIHKLKSENKKYEITWSIIERECQPRPRIETCRLCLKEALLILQADKSCINKRSEVMSSCRHRNRFLLFNWNETKT